MKHITPNALRDFQVCSLYYDFRYQEKLPISLNVRERRVEKFDEAIKRVCTFFFYKKQAYSEPSYQALLNRWQKLWFSEGSTAADLAALKNEVLWGNDTSYTTQAAVALLKFYEEFADDKDTQVILVDEKFNVPINKKVALESSFDLVLRTKDADGNPHYKIYKWITNNLKKPLSYWTFDLAMQDYAFRFRNENQNIKTSFYVWDFGSTIPGGKEIVIEQDDINGLIFWANELEKTQVHVPRRGLTSYCRSCPFDKQCKNWSFKREQDK